MHELMNISKSWWHVKKVEKIKNPFDFFTYYKTEWNGQKTLSISLSVARKVHSLQTWQIEID